MMSVEVCRKIKAVLLMAMLAGAEIHQARYATGATSRQFTQQMEIPNAEQAQQFTQQMEVMMANPSLQKENQRVTDQLEAMMANPNFQSRTKRLAEQMEAMMANPALQKEAQHVYEKIGARNVDQNLNSEEQAKLVAEQLEAMMTGPKFKEMKRLTDEVEAMMADTTLQKEANRVAEQVKAMQADPTFQNQANILKEQLNSIESDPKLEVDPEMQEEASRMTEQVDAMMTNPHLQERAANLAEKMQTLKGDANLNDKAKHIAERLDAMRTDAHFKDQAKLVGEQMEAMMANTDSQEHVQRFEEQLMAMMSNPALQEHKQSLKKQMKAMMGDATMQDTMQHVQEQVQAMKADSKFMGMAKGLTAQMESMMTDTNVQDASADQESSAEAPITEGRRLAEQDADFGDNRVDEVLDYFADNIVDKLFDRSSQEETAPQTLEHATLGKQGHVAMPASSSSRMSVSTAARGQASRLATSLPMGLRMRPTPQSRKPWAPLHLPPPAASNAKTVMSMGGDDDTPQGEFTAEELEFFRLRSLLPFKTSKRIDALEGGWGSALLVLGTIFSMTLANSAWGAGYIAFWETKVGYGPMAWHLTLPLKEWVNEMVMAFFFFLVGLEIKQEFLFGSLADMRKAALPCIAALGGMVVPAAVFCGVQAATGGSLTGWAIPMATDIAFAMGVYNLFANKLPKSMSAFLLTLATVDDLGAIAVIAVFFAKHINAMWLAGAGLMGVTLEVFRRQRVRNSKAFLAVGAGLWYCLLRGGVNADVAGVLAAFAIPAVAAPEHTKALNKYPNLLNHFIHYWVGWANFVIMPLFAIANTAVSLGGVTAGAVAMAPKAQGIMAGLLLGKPIGIAGASLAALGSGICTWPEGLKTRHLWLSGLLGGIAFTMSLFLIEQSLTGPVVMSAKLAVIVGSTTAALGAAAGASFQKAPSLPPPPPAITTNSTAPA